MNVALTETKSSKWKQPWIYVVPTCLLLIFAILWFTWQRPGTWEHPPVYPRAQQASYTISRANDTLRAITAAFVTDDPPEKVLAFYKHELRSDRWEPDEYAAEPANLSFYWTTHQSFSNMYTLDISTEQQRDGGTRVIILSGLILGR